VTRLGVAAVTPMPSGSLVVNRSVAREYLGEGAVGQRLQLGLSPMLDCEVVGVAEDAPQGEFSEPVRPEFLASYRQMPDGVAFDHLLLLRTSADPVGHAGTLRAVVRHVDPSVVVDSIVTLEDGVMTNLGRRRACALGPAGLAAFALPIAGVGWTREIGVRLAVGAERHRCARAEAALLIGVGVAAGLTVTLIAAESLSKSLYSSASRDSVSFTAAPPAIGLVWGVACIVPARRATPVDPLRALR
jgi:hypothetical protein